MFLGLDIGTSSVKALLIDAQQNIIGSTEAALQVSRTHPGWSEQDPAHWTLACEQVLDGLLQNYRQQLGAVTGIGLSGHMHGATLLDQSDNILRPCILWNDTRSFKQAAFLDANPQFRAISGNIVFPGFTAPKLVWVQHNEPEIFSQVAKVLLPKDYVRLWLTGEHVAEMSDAAGTSWLDTGARRWSRELLSASGMDIGQMPRLVEGTEISGTLRPQLAARWGIKPGAAVAGGAGDNAASAIGMGTIAPGSAFISLGTSGVLFAANDQYLPDPQSAIHTFCHALPNRWHQMGVILSATDALNWYAGITGLTAAELTAELGEDLHAPGAETFLPYLSGERTPHNDAAIRGSFTGLGHDSDRATLTRAVLEGVAFALRDSLEALRTTGTKIEDLIAVGGGSRSRLWLKMIATILGTSIKRPVAGDFGAAFGAARLGLIAATRADPLTVSTPPSISETIQPDTKLQSAFDDAWARYHALYPAIKGTLS